MEIENFTFKNWFYKNQRIVVFLAALIFIVYINSLNNGFVADDVPGILNNPLLGDFSSVFRNPFYFLRPLLYFITFKFFGLNPLFFRLINIFFHIGTAILVYILIEIIADSRLALLTSSIFAVHPVLVESITWISGGAHVQYSFFFLVSLISYIIYLFKKNKKILVCSLIFFILALTTSEKAIVLPIIAGFYLLAFGDFPKNWKGLIPFLVVGLFFGLFYLGAIGKRVADLQSQFYSEPVRNNPFLQIPIAITSYLELIFWPKDLTLYHSEMFFTRQEYALRLLIFILFLTAIIYFWKKNRQISFWLLFFLISLLSTLLPLGIAWIVAERYVYLGSIGIIFLIAFIVQKIGEKVKNKQIAYAILAVIVLLLGARTIIRNNDWENQDALWLASAKTSPSSPQNHNNLGDYYGRQGDFNKAIEEFKKAIELNSNYGDAYHNLANTYQGLGQTDLAIENYKKATEINQNLWQSYQNLASIYFEQEKFEMAKENMEKAIRANPENANLYLNLGIIYLKLENQQEAQKYFQKAIELNPQLEQQFR